jgi:hypothetical protein
VTPCHPGPLVKKQCCPVTSPISCVPQIFKEWGIKQKALEEEKVKRVTVLEAELRAARTSLEEGVTRHDEQLAVLAQRRLRVQVILICVVDDVCGSF